MSEFILFCNMRIWADLGIGLMLAAAVGLPLYAAIELIIETIKELRR